MAVIARTALLFGRRYCSRVVIVIEGRRVHFRRRRNIKKSWVDAWTTFQWQAFIYTVQLYHYGFYLFISIHCRDHLWNFQEFMSWKFYLSHWILELYNSFRQHCNCSVKKEESYMTSLYRYYRNIFYYQEQ